MDNTLGCVLQLKQHYKQHKLVVIHPGIGVYMCVSPVFTAKAFTDVHRASFPCTRVNIFHCKMHVLNGIQTSL